MYVLHMCTAHVQTMTARSLKVRACVRACVRVGVHAFLLGGGVGVGVEWVILSEISFSFSGGDEGETKKTRAI